MTKTSTDSVQREAPTSNHRRLFDGLVVAHAAVSGAMMANPGRHFAKRLVEQGAELHFFASRQKIYHRLPPVEELEDGIGGQFHGLPLPQGLAPFRAAQTLWQMTRDLRRLRVQVIHTRSTMMIHHQDDIYCRDETLPPLKRWIAGSIERQLARLTDRSLFISYAVLEDALAMGFPREKCVWVGLDLDEIFQEAAGESDRTGEPVLGRLREIGVPPGASIVGCVARLVPHKGLDLLLDAAALLAAEFPGWAFVVKGDGPLRESLETAIVDKGLSGRAFLLADDLPREHLPALYRCFDIFALPTRREGFGLVFAEAMTMGLPVVGPCMPPITEVVPQDRGLLVEPENAQALAQGLCHLMADASLRSRLGRKGREYALATWSNQRAAERVISVYREILEQKQGRYHSRYS